MRIGELAREAGTDVETVRYYEREGLLSPPLRRANGYRDYGGAHLERLTFVRHCRVLDMSLADVRRLLAFVDRPEQDCDDINHLIDEQLERVRTRLSALGALEVQLDTLRRRCDAGHRPARDCGILGELVSAARRQSCVCHAESPDGRRSETGEA